MVIDQMHAYRVEEEVLSGREIEEAVDVLGGWAAGNLEEAMTTLAAMKGEKETEERTETISGVEELSKKVKGVLDRLAHWREFAAREVDLDPVAWDEDHLTLILSPSAPTPHPTTAHQTDESERAKRERDVVLKRLEDVRNECLKRVEELEDGEEVRGVGVSLKLRRDQLRVLENAVTGARREVGVLVGKVLELTEKVDAPHVREREEESLRLTLKSFEESIGRFGGWRRGVEDLLKETMELREETLQHLCGCIKLTDATAAATHTHTDPLFETYFQKYQPLSSKKDDQKELSDDEIVKETEKEFAIIRERLASLGPTRTPPASIGGGVPPYNPDEAVFPILGRAERLKDSLQKAGWTEDLRKKSGVGIRDVKDLDEDERLRIYQNLGTPIREPFPLPPTPPTRLPLPARRTVAVPSTERTYRIPIEFDAVNRGPPYHPLNGLQRSRARPPVVRRHTAGQQQGHQHVTPPAKQPQQQKREIKVVKQDTDTKPLSKPERIRQSILNVLRGLTVGSAGFEAPLIYDEGSGVVWPGIALKAQEEHEGDSKDKQHGKKEGEQKREGSHPYPQQRKPSQKRNAHNQPESRKTSFATALEGFSGDRNISGPAGRVGGASGTGFGIRRVPVAERYGPRHPLAREVEIRYESGTTTTDDSGSGTTPSSTGEINSVIERTSEEVRLQNQGRSKYDGGDVARFVEVMDIDVEGEAEEGDKGVRDKIRGIAEEIEML
ncbi:hypothetical protein HK097_005244, partial [Rhizophlyctis rosea]